MTEDSNGLDDVAHFLFYPDEMNEVLSYEDALHSSNDNVSNEGLKSSTIDGPCQNQIFRLIDDDLSYDPGKAIISNTKIGLFRKYSVERNTTLNPNLISSFNSSYTSSRVPLLQYTNATISQRKFQRLVLNTV